MAALVVLVVLTLSVGFWLLTPVIAALAPLATVKPLPWLLLLTGLWLLAGRSADSG